MKRFARKRHTRPRHHVRHFGGRHRRGAGANLRAQPAAAKTLPRFPFRRAFAKQFCSLGEGRPVTTGEISQLNFLLGEEFAAAALAACRKFRVPPSRIAVIGSHGQTVFHQGVAARFCGKSVASTLQIGEPSVIAARTGITTVGDFRPADMAAGGQGAPLVPFVDYLLYRHTRIGRAALNIGGIANVTVIPAGAKSRRCLRLRYRAETWSSTPWCGTLRGGRKTFDRNAEMAGRGELLPGLARIVVCATNIFSGRRQKRRDANNTAKNMFVLCSRIPKRAAQSPKTSCARRPS